MSHPAIVTAAAFMSFPSQRTARLTGGQTNNPLAVLAVAMLAAAVCAYAFSTVIPERLPVYSRPSASAPVVTSLERGQNVTIDVTISRAEGDWCLIRESGRKDATGYCLCSQLAGKEPIPRTRPVPPPQQQPPAVAPEPAKPQAPALRVGDAGQRISPEFWAVQLALTPEQRKVMNGLLSTSGLAAVRDDLERTYRRHGVDDDYSLLRAASRSNVTER